MLPAHIASERALLAAGGRYAYLHVQYLAEHEEALKTAKESAPQLEAQLHDLERAYHELGFDEVEYGAWTPGETWIGGHGIREVGRVLAMRGTPAGLKPTGIEFDIALTALSAGAVLQLGRTLLKKVLGGAPKVSPLSIRVREIHEALDDIAQTMRTTAILETKDGTRIVGSGVADLLPRQRALLGAGEVAAKLPREHAEITVLEHAARNGLRPSELAVSRTICGDCREAIEAAGGRITSPTTAEFSR
jgi:hypothetical protein